MAYGAVFATIDKVAKNKHMSTRGGSAHQRAMGAKKSEVVDREAPMVDMAKSETLQPNKPSTSPPNSIPEWKKPLNRADSIGLFGVLMGTIFVIIVPSVWQKLPAFVLICFGSAYFIWLSHWAHALKKWVRVFLILVVLVGLNIGVVPQFIAQWRLEHMRSELKFDASAPNIAYPDGDHYGIRWAKDFSEVRLTVKSGSIAPIQNVALSVSVMEKGEAIVGMAQADQELGGCVVRRPRENRVPDFLLRGVDGSRANIAPFMNDMMNGKDIWGFRDHYDILCQRILAAESIPLVVGTNSVQPNVPPKHLRVTGDYETTAAEGSKRIRVDEVVSVSVPERWK